jgi:hypothetical protein
MPFKKFREELKQRKQLHNSAKKYGDKKYKLDEEPVKKEECNQALDQILQRMARQKFAKWYETNIENRYKQLALGIGTTKGDSTLNNDFTLFNSIFDDYYEPKLASNPKMIALADKYYFDTSSLDTSVFDFKTLSNPDDLPSMNWTYSKTEFQGVIVDSLNKMLKEGSRDGLFNSILSECFSSITDKNGRSFIDNIDFIVLSHLLITAFIPAYTAYEPVYKQKLSSLGALLTNPEINKAYFEGLGGKIGIETTSEDEEGFEIETERPETSDKEKTPATKIIRAFSWLITELSNSKSELAAKLIILLGSKRSFDSLLKTLKETKPTHIKIKAKTIYELAFKLFNLIKTEHLIMQKLAPKLIDLQKALDTMPKFIDRATFEKLQSNVISRIEKEEPEDDEEE